MVAQSNVGSASSTGEWIIADDPIEPPCSPRGRLNPLDAHVDCAVFEWARVVRGARHLAFARRLWGLLGQHLQVVKRRGKLQ